MTVVKPAFGASRPLFAVVTDGERLAPGPRTAGDRRACLLDQARRAIEAGVDVFQLRERTMDADDLCALTVAAVSAARGSRTRILVNDRLDVAMAAGADGVHLRGDSLPATRVRALAPPGFLIGRSVHDPDEVASASLDVDYLVAGTVFPTPSKPRGPWLGLAGLAEVVRRAAVPVLAIGGVTTARAGAVAATGAAGVAAIELFLAPADRRAPDGCRSGPLGEVVAAVRMRFDSVKMPS